MFQEPADVPGECNAHLHIGDDHGENHATMRCHLVSGHVGDHEEVWEQGRVLWQIDERDEWCFPKD